jgi:hypothetical protein
LEVIFFWFRKVFSRLRVPDATICRLKPSPWTHPSIGCETTNISAFYRPRRWK